MPVNYQSQGKKLMGVVQLFRESLRTHRHNFSSLFSISSLPALSSILFLILLLFLSKTSFQYSFLFSLLKSLLYLAIFLLFPLSTIAIVNQLKDGSGTKKSYKESLNLLLPILLIYLLLSILTSGGFVFLLIPGLIFLTWFHLAPFTLVYENERGIKALERSKSLVRGRFFHIFFRLLLLIVIVAILAFLIPYLISRLIASGELAIFSGILVSLSLSILYLPFSLVYLHFIYKDLVSLKAEEPSLERVSLKNPLYLFPTLCGFLILSFLLTISFLNIFWGRDIAPINDSDLRLTKVFIAPKENAFYELKKATAKLHTEQLNISSPQYQYYKDLYEAMLKGERLNTREAKEWIERNEEALKYVDRALTRPHYQLPYIADPSRIAPNTLYRQLTAIRELARWCVIKGNYLTVQGKGKEALSWYLKALRLGQMVEDSPRPAGLMQYLVGRATKEIALSGIRNAMDKINFSPKELKSIANALKRFEENTEALRKALQMEYMVVANYIDLHTKNPQKYPLISFQGEEERKCCSKRMLLKWSFLPNETKKLFHDRFLHMIENAGKLYKDVDFRAIRGEESEIEEGRSCSLFLRGFQDFYKDIIKPIFTRNWLGKDSSREELLFTDIAFEQPSLEKFSLRATETILALKAYKLEKGKLPSNLSDLVPTYLSQMPIDPFDGKPLRYSREKMLVYCVGKDLKDSGAINIRKTYTPWGVRMVEEKELSEMDDPAIRIKL